MSKNSFSFKFFKNKYLTLKNFILAFICSLFVLPFVLIFEFVLNKKWFDGMSVVAIIYICLGFLIIVFSIAEFKTWTKFKNLFAIKKENNEQFSNFEKMQMKILNIDNNVKEDDEVTKSKRKDVFRFVAVFMIIFGIILLIVSLPFVFN